MDTYLLMSRCSPKINNQADIPESTVTGDVGYVVLKVKGKLNIKVGDAKYVT